MRTQVTENNMKRFLFFIEITANFIFNKLSFVLTCLEMKLSGAFDLFQKIND